MAKFLCGNDLRVLSFIAAHPKINGRQLALTFAQSCDITHVVAGLRDRGLVRRLDGRQWSTHSYVVSKDGKRQLAQVQKPQHITS
jgi:hypothetical protein